MAFHDRVYQQEDIDCHCQVLCVAAQLFLGEGALAVPPVWGGPSNLLPLALLLPCYAGIARSVGFARCTCLFEGSLIGKVIQVVALDCCKFWVAVRQWGWGDFTERGAEGKEPGGWGWGRCWG